MDYTVHGILQARSGVGSLSILQGIFPTQGSNPGLPHCGWILYQLSHKGSPSHSHGGSGDLHVDKCSHFSGPAYSTSPRPGHRALLSGPGTPPSLGMPLDSHSQSPPLLPPLSQPSTADTPGFSRGRLFHLYLFPSRPLLVLRLMIAKSVSLVWTSP